MSEIEEVRVSLFGCFMPQHPTKRRRLLDRTMIGYPTNFRHSFSASRFMESSFLPTEALRDKMASKGGYEETPLKEETV
ncbi:unnamed protein product [Phyllotreta striolata]|uniref:Uncharacterized protein n=1 Tax=Phyllotreta striolata TaxID=444603 RepID=A0A9N9TQH4_PHYSR|nr:unnamed protein product [Phyllotreta striolata]